jgi:hypothetical protein
VILSNLRVKKASAVAEALRNLIGLAFFQLNIGEKSGLSR